MIIIIAGRVFNLQHCKAVTKHEDHLILDWNDATLTDISFNSEPECMDAFRTVVSLMNPTVEVEAGEVIQNDEC